MYKGGLVFQAIPKKCETKVEYLFKSKFWNWFKAPKYNWQR